MSEEWSDFRHSDRGSTISATVIVPATVLLLIAAVVTK